MIAGELMGHDDDFHHGYTFSGHPVACAVALENLQNHRGGGARCARKGVRRTGARQDAFRNSRIIRSSARFAPSGSRLGAIELVADKRTRRRFADPGRVGLICRDHFFREGFIMRAVFDTMVMAPPLIWTQTQFDEAEEVIGRALDLTLNDVAGEIAA